MTACFLFSAAGGESSRFNYFRNFSDPASAALHRQNGLPTKAHRTSGPVHLQCRNLSTSGFSVILLALHLISFSTRTAFLLKRKPAAFLQEVFFGKKWEFCTFYPTFNLYVYAHVYVH